MQTSQENAIKKVKGPCVILAGAGTGKTYTIVEKIKYLIENKVCPPEKIVALTFSNEAAFSMKTRVLNAIHDKEPVIKTFHAFCSDLLKQYGSKMGIDENFKILIPDDAKIMMHKSFKLSPNLCHSYIGTIGIAKDLGISIESLEGFLEKKDPRGIEELEKEARDLQLKIQMIPSVKEDKGEKSSLKERLDTLVDILQAKKFLRSWKSYEKIKTVKKFQDYSDLNRNALILLEKFPEVSREFEYIIVDEFQDTNKLQCDFLEKLAPHRNITVVGDLNQSIYRFRGAYKRNLDDFREKFKISRDDIFALDKSYRSTNKILRAAYNLILNNYKNKEECFPVHNALGEEGEKIDVYRLKNNREEARKIVEIIREAIKSGISPEEICVMFRTHHQSKLLKSVLDSEGIAYSSVTRNSLMKVASVKMALSYLIIVSKIKNNSRRGEHAKGTGSSRSEESAWWDLAHLSGFSKEDSIKIGKYIKGLREEECLSQKVMESFSEIELSEQGKVRMRVLVSKVNEMLKFSDLDVPDLLLKIYETAGLNPEDENSEKEKMLSLQKFYELAKEYNESEFLGLEGFLHHIEVINSLGIEIGSPNVENGGVRIMTHHSTKGLEYELVIVSNMADKRFPIERADKQIIPPQLSPEIANELKGIPEHEADEFSKNYTLENQVMEERRLCYVAFTRAKKKLVLTYAQEYGSKKHMPSKFLGEINFSENKDISFEIDEAERYDELIKIGNNLIETSFVPGNVIFSPSSLQTFNDCQKRYEYKYIYNMPEPVSASLASISLGSFVHLVFEKGVKARYSTEKEFVELAKSLQTLEEWSMIDIEEALHLVRVFFYRNKNKYSEKSLTEKDLNFSIDGIKFFGRADRIDFHPDGLEIIDYKTGNSAIRPKYRNWQLGFYAIASRSIGKPKRLTLDTLRKDSSIEFVIDERGNAKEINSPRTSFNLEEVKNEMIGTARRILECYQKGFSPCPVDKSCDFCNEFIWNV